MFAVTNRLICGFEGKARPVLSYPFAWQFGSITQILAFGFVIWCVQPNYQMKGYIEYYERTSFYDDIIP